MPGDGSHERAHDELHPCVETTPGESRYLLAILDLTGEGTVPSQAAVARSLNVAQPTALQMLRRLRKMGFVRDDRVELTPAGVSATLTLRHRHQAARILTRDILGLPEDEADHEALRLAGNVSSPLARRLTRWRATAPQRGPAGEG
jgi:Mn-dependent DtxR family transcriptional regulator